MRDDEIARCASPDSAGATGNLLDNKKITYAGKSLPVKSPTLNFSRAAAALLNVILEQDDHAEGDEEEPWVPVDPNL